MSLTRRSFIKKSSYSAAAVTVLGSGVALSNQSSSWFHKHKCDNSLTPATGMGGLSKYGKVESPVGSGVYYYFPLYDCVCVKNSHPLGVHSGPQQVLGSDPVGVIVTEYQLTTVPPVHVDNHS